MTRSIHPDRAVRVLIAGFVLAAVVAACSTTSGRSDAGGAGVLATSPAPAAAPIRAPVSRDARDVARIVTDLRAASVRHDATAEVVYRNELANRLGADALGSLEATYRLARADVHTAMISHDAQGIALHRAQFETLCARGSLTRLLEDCDADLTAAMR